MTFKISKFLQITGIINNFKPFSSPKEHTRLKIYSTLPLPTLCYGCETWAIREQDKYRITSAEMKFVMSRQNARGKIEKSMKIFYQNIKLTQL